MNTTQNRKSGECIVCACIHVRTLIQSKVFSHPAGTGSRTGTFSTSHMIAGAALIPSAHASAAASIIFVCGLLAPRWNSSNRDGVRKAKAHPMSSKNDVQRSVRIMIADPVQFFEAARQPKSYTQRLIEEFVSYDSAPLNKTILPLPEQTMPPPTPTPTLR